MAHARRKFYDLHEANQSALAAQALEYIGQLYMIERKTKDLPPDKRHAIRHEKARPIADALHQWMLVYQQKVPDGSSTARALDYLKRWTELMHYLDGGIVTIENSWVENQIRPWALGRSNRLFVDSLKKWAARCCSYAPDPVGQTQRTRSVCLFKRCSDEAVDAKKHYRCVATAQLDAGDR